MNRERAVSQAERGYWLFQQLHPSSSAHNFSVAARVRGPLDLAALHRALELLYARHPALRTRYPSRGKGPIAEVIAQPQLDFEVIETASMDEAEVLSRAAAEASRPFSLATGVPVRVRVFRRSASEHLLVLAGHHIALDLWSTVVIVKELIHVYPRVLRSQPIELPDCEHEDDWIRDREQRLAGPEGEQLWEFWRGVLAAPLPVLELATDRPRAALRTLRGQTHRFRIDDALTDKLRRLARQNHTTLYTVLLAAYQVLLHRLTGQNDLIVGSPMAGRNHRRLAETVGCLINVVPLRASFESDPTFTDLLAQAQRVVRGAVTHQLMPLPAMIERLATKADGSRPPLFQTLFAFERAQGKDLASVAAFVLRSKGGSITLGSLVLESVDLENPSADYELMLSMGDMAEGLLGTLTFNADLFDRATVESIAQQLEVLLEGVVADPNQKVSKLPRLLPHQQQRLVVDWNQTSAPTPPLPIHELFLAQVRRTPNGVALIRGSDRMTYQDLNARANRLAERLKTAGAGPEQKVAILVDRSFDLIVASLAVLKAGAAFVPLDPAYPPARIAFVLDDCDARIVITQAWAVNELKELSRELAREVAVIDLAALDIAAVDPLPQGPDVSESSLAYLIYTSGSTGQPKGVMVTHGNLANFFTAMNSRVKGGVGDVWLAVSSASFDISVLELFWTLTRGFTLSIYEGQRARSRGAPHRADERKPIEFSLFYFANDEGAATERGKYQLLLEGARFADASGFAAVWTPERHFHPFGGLYPNPAVAGAAIAAVTHRVAIRAGSVVLPLHDPIRVVEEWSVVDNLSGGRVGISIASGWHSDDFVLAPHNYDRRKEVTARNLETVRALWRGETVTAPGGNGQPVTLTTHPRPVQAELPVWLTAAGNKATFEAAGRLGANLLTHLLGQTHEDLAERIGIYREAWRAAGHPGDGHVTLMVHSFVGPDRERVREQVRAPMLRYLASSLDLAQGASRSAAELDEMLARSFDRYFETSGLFGTPAECAKLAMRLHAEGVDELACLIDFGVSTEEVLEALPALAQASERSRERSGSSVADQLLQDSATHLQCTPSLIKLLLADPNGPKALERLKVLLVGGEPISLAIADQLHALPVAELHNMYGPTETTIWSTMHRMTPGESSVSVGRPIDNTRLYIVDAGGELVPSGSVGELWIGGAGVARGYHRRSELSAARFVQDPFVAGAGKVYKTGDRARYRPDGSVEVLGRVDDQVKIRGHRAEPGEVEQVLSTHSQVVAAAVVAVPDPASGWKLVAYVVPRRPTLSARDLRPFLMERLPEPLVPSEYVLIDAIPLTPARKVDRVALAKVVPAPARLGERLLSPGGQLEEALVGYVGDRLGATIEAHDNFFEVGGHSLLAAELLAWVKDTFEVELELQVVLETPTMAGLAGAIRAAVDDVKVAEASAALFNSGWPTRATVTFGQEDDPS